MKTLAKLFHALFVFFTSPGLWPFSSRWWGKAAYALLFVALTGKLFVAFAYPAAFRWYTGDKTGRIYFDTSREVSPTEFEKLARELEGEAMRSFVQEATLREEDEIFRKEKDRLYKSLHSVRKKASYDHIKYFRQAGIRKYEGPSTCLSCHQRIKVTDIDGSIKEANLMEDVMSSTHFLLFGMHSQFSTYGYDGQAVNKEARNIPVGKIDRACGIPGSFTWTGWAALIEAKPEEGPPVTRSEGCGQCHIGGMYGPPSDKMMPISIDDRHRKEAIDCLICHSSSYDMNHKYAVQDDVGTRWNQDRTMKAAMTVGRPPAEACLRCHQHNMGGDTYEHNEAAKSLGYRNQRLLHGWSKRGTPFSAYDDVHAKAGMNCLDCHKSVGHKIARGKRGVDLVSNDLPDVEVSCEQCHTAAPHFKNKATRAILNGHTARIACQTCHITKLQENSVVLIDWVNPHFEKEEGIWSPNVLLRSGDVRKTVGYLWYNGNGTFLANALGDNPSNPGNYNPLMFNITQYSRDPELQIEGGGIRDNDFLTQLTPEMFEKRRKMVELNIMPHQRLGVSKIQPFHLFNAYMWEDMSNQGPFGAMILPFDYKSYFETGDSRKSVDVAISHPIVKRMYQTPFKLYMMDQFMFYFGVMEGWEPVHPHDNNYKGEVKPHWMRQMGTIALNHGIKAKGFSCKTCHTENGLLPFRELGYSEARSRDIENPPELKYFENVDTGVGFEDIYPSHAETNGTEQAH